MNFKGLPTLGIGVSLILLDLIDSLILIELILDSFSSKFEVLSIGTLDSLVSIWYLVGNASLHDGQSGDKFFYIYYLTHE